MTLRNVQMTCVSACASAVKKRLKLADMISTLRLMQMNNFMSNVSRQHLLASRFFSSFKKSAKESEDFTIF